MRTFLQLCGDLLPPPFRLNVVAPRLPPLREWQPDLSALTDHLLAVLTTHYRRAPIHLSRDAEAALVAVASSTLL